MNATLMNQTTYYGMIDIIEDEIDEPHMSGYTGYYPSND